MTGERIKLFDVDDKLVDEMTLPPGYMEGFAPRAVIAHGRKFVEGGRRDSFYLRGEFAEVRKDVDAS